MKSILFLSSSPHRRNSTHASYIFFFSYSTQTILVLAHLLFSLIISKQFFNSSSCCAFSILSVSTKIIVQLILLEQVESFLFSLIISKQLFNSSKLLCVFFSLHFYQNNYSTHPSFWAFSFLSAYTQTIARFILILYRFLFSPIPPKQLFNSIIYFSLPSLLVWCTRL